MFKKPSVDLYPGYDSYPGSLDMIIRMSFPLKYDTHQASHSVHKQSQCFTVNSRKRHTLHHQLSIFLVEYSLQMCCNVRMHECLLSS
jgi:hypothetical protein